MKRFEFRLQQVLSYRRMQEDLETARLRQLEDELEKRRQDLTALATEHSEETRLSATSAPGRAILANYRAAYDRQSVKLSARIEEQQKLVKQQMQLVVQARQRAEVLEKVRKKQKTDWEKSFQKELDSLAMDSYLARWKQ